MHFSCDKLLSRLYIYACVREVHVLFNRIFEYVQATQHPRCMHAYVIRLILPPPAIICSSIYRLMMMNAGGNRIDLMMMMMSMDEYRVRELQ